MKNILLPALAALVLSAAPARAQQAAAPAADEGQPVLTQVDRLAAALSGVVDPKWNPADEGKYADPCRAHDNDGPDHYCEFEGILDIDAGIEKDKGLILTVRYVTSVMRWEGDTAYAEDARYHKRTLTRRFKIKGIDAGYAAGTDFVVVADRDGRLVFRDKKVPADMSEATVSPTWLWFALQKAAERRAPLASAASAQGPAVDLKQEAQSAARVRAALATAGAIGDGGVLQSN
ncbi:MAG TPA: hypothetical protein VH309_05500 [Elusimicrobiota bacterium]|jgi:hypothetical protein|nr:hypothetical protein [Elusimicrobiota bacterium]